MDEPFRSFADAPDCALCEFAAKGFASPVPGVVYRTGLRGRGMPLGALGTGYLELTGTGRLGDATIFNHFPAAHTGAQPPRFDSPFLAVCVSSDVRVLALPPAEPDRAVSPGPAAFAPGLAYWGHFPFAEISFDLDIPVAVCLRAWTPFVPGDAESSNMPATIFELELAGRGDRPLDARVAFAFPAYPVVEGARYRGAPLSGSVRGVSKTTGQYGREVGFALGLAGAQHVESGALLGVPGNPWSAMGRGVASPSETDPGATVAGTVRLEPGVPVVLVFVLAWYYPAFRVGYAFPYEHMYGQRFEGCAAVFDSVLSRISELREATLGWQRAVYGQKLPAFLRDGLVNSVYCLAKNSWWTCAHGADDPWGPRGLLTVNESFRDCPVTETVPCRFFGSYPLLMLFPELEETALRVLARFQLVSGEIPFALAYGSGLFDPRYHCVHPLNSSMFVQMAYRLFLRTGDAAFLRDMLPAVTAAVRYMRSLDSDCDGLVNEHPHPLPGTYWPANNYHDTFPWYGTSVYTAGAAVTTLRAASAIARALQDDALRRDCEAELSRAAEALDTKLWAGDRYLVYNDPEHGRCLDASLLNQLMGEWCSRQLGLPSPFPSDHAEKAIEHALRCNVASVGALPIDTVGRDGRAFIVPETAEDPDPASRQSASCMVSEAICFAMTLLWRGRRADGLRILEALWRAHAISHRTPFEQYYMIDPADGAPIWGNDYYSNMVLWAVPMALEGQTLADYACSPLIAGCLGRTPTGRNGTGTG